MTDLGFGAASRLEQLDALAEINVNNKPVLIHGSLAHAALRGVSLPSETKMFGEQRDIDVYTQGAAGKLAAEGALENLGLSEPNPIDAGLCGILISDGDGFALYKDDITVEVGTPEIFAETRDYEIVGTDGLKIRSFTPVGLLAVHFFQPYGRPSHQVPDRQFLAWTKRNNVSMPDELAKSIEQFREEYRKKYPYGATLRYAADIYAHVLPENIRKRFRRSTHAFMKKHAGRENPYS